ERPVFGERGNSIPDPQRPVFLLHNGVDGSFEAVCRGKLLYLGVDEVRFLGDGEISGHDSEKRTQNSSAQVPHRASYLFKSSIRYSVISGELISESFCIQVFLSSGLVSFRARATICLAAPFKNSALITSFFVSMSACEL